MSGPVYTVQVHDREDGVYVFAEEADARRFEDAVNRAAGPFSCVLEEQTVCDTAQADALISAEAES